MRNERGMTIWGMAIIVLLVGFFALMALKLVPPYMQNFKIKTALAELKNQAGGMSREEIVNALQKRFDVDDVDNVDPRTALKIESGNRVRILRIAYQVKVPLFYNVSALIDFNDSVEVANVAGS